MLLTPSALWTVSPRLPSIPEWPWAPWFPLLTSSGFFLSFLPEEGYKGLESSLPTFDIGFGCCVLWVFFVVVVVVYLFFSEINVCKIKKIQFKKKKHAAESIQGKKRTSKKNYVIVWIETLPVPSSHVWGFSFQFFKFRNKCLIKKKT